MSWLNNIIVFTFFSDTKRSKVYPSSDASSEDSLFIYVVYSLANVHCMSWRMNHSQKQDPASNITREIEFDSHDGGEDGEHTDVSFMQISRIFAKEHAFFFGMKKMKKV